jgi:hypothetical protein
MKIKTDGIDKKAKEPNPHQKQWNGKKVIIMPKG